MKAAFDFPLHPLAREDGERLRGAWFDEPDEWLVADAPADLAALIDRAHCAALQGAWVLGGLRYEAAAALDPVLRVLPNEGGPLAQFAVYRRPPQPWPTSVAGATERCAPWQQCLHDEAADHAGPAAGSADHQRARTGDDAPRPAGARRPAGDPSGGHPSPQAGRTGR